VRPDPVVVLAPQLDLPPRVVERDDDLLAEAFFAQPRVETLDVRVLDRLARFDELQRQGFQLRLIPALALERTREAMSNSSWAPLRGWLSRLRQSRSLPRASARRTSDTSRSP
jgi:hypothetical protein